MANEEPANDRDAATAMADASRLLATSAQLSDDGHAAEAAVVALQAVQVLQQADAPADAVKAMYWLQLADTLHNLVVRLESAGHPEQVSGPVEEALIAYQTAASSGADVLRVAALLRTLSIRASDAELPDLAVEAAQAAADLLRQLQPSADRVQEYHSLFALVLFDVVVRLITARHPDAADEPASEAIQEYRDAAADGADVMDTSAVLLTLSLRTSEAGLVDAGVAAARAAVDVLRSFDAPPDQEKAYLSLFAQTLYTLAVRLVTAQQLDQAGGPAREAADIYGQLVEIDPAGYAGVLDDAMRLADSLSEGPTADLIENLGTERIGQLTGSRDPQGRLLLNVTNTWTAEGLDLGANTEHNNRLYFFFGDVATTDNGEHRPQGWTFFLPNDHQGATDAIGQKDWRFCNRCHGLFWAPNGETAGSICPNGGEHYFHPDSWNFVLPNDHQGAIDTDGQRGWRFCEKCHALFWAAGEDGGRRTCPAGDQHSFPPDGWNFVLPNDQQGATPTTGQGDWHVCAKCHSLAFFPGSSADGSACSAGNPRNSDLVAWTDDTAVTPPLRIGHQEVGWNFVLPNVQQGATSSSGQPDWRFCGRCHGLFWAPGNVTAATVCPAGDQHTFPPDSWTFILPDDHQGASDATGQKDWRFCDRCHGLFWAPDSKSADTVCPVGGVEHSFNAESWTFFLPSREQGATESSGQPDWRFCGQCHGLFWNGVSDKGICPAMQGGGIHLHPVMKATGAEFDPIAGDWPVGITKSLEAPGGAFSHNGRARVFVNISPERWSEHRRPGDPQYGTYLISKDDPEQPGPYRVDFLFSPRVGACPRNEGGDPIESHEPLGDTFVVPHDNDDGISRQKGWRRCSRCAAMFLDADGDGVGGACWHTGNGHVADGIQYDLPLAPGTDGEQSAWTRCGQCDSLFWNGDPTGNRGRCRAGGAHRPADVELALPHRVDVDNPNRVSQWRFCVNCAGMFWTGGFIVHESDDFCLKTGGRHQPAGFDFALAHDVAANALSQANWRHCKRCAALFWASEGGGPAGVCAKEGAHEAGGATSPYAQIYDFVLPHDVAAESTRQSGWRFCGKCHGLFWAGHPTEGYCPADGGGHLAGTGPAAPGFDFALSHFSPGDDPFHNESGWRFCVRCFQLVWAGYADRLSGVAPAIVKTSEHSFLQDSDAESALFITAFGFAPSTGFRLAYLPLGQGAEPALRDTRYYTGRDAAGNAQWSPDDRLAKDLFPHTGYTSVSASWQPGPRRWLIFYSNANDEDPNAFELPAVVRIARTPMDWPDATEITVFDPADAYGTYMHKPGLDDIDVRVPPRGDEHKGWTYGLYLLERYITWSDVTRELDLYYLLSPSSPYQVQLMHTKLRITEM